MRTLLLVPLLALFAAAADADAQRGQQGPETVRQTNEYANYVHFQPEWKSYPKNLIVDITADWVREVGPDSPEPDITKHGANRQLGALQYVNSKPVVSVSYDYMDCQPQWFHYVKTGLDFLGEHLGQHGPREAKNGAYPDAVQAELLKDGFAQFVPICTSRDHTNYDYTIHINDDTIGFDAYFVPSLAEQWDYFLYPEHFEHYEGCSAINYQRFEGTCEGVSADSGLLIVIPDELSRPTTKITVKLTEAY